MGNGRNGAVGFAGLGLMGQHMARHLAGAGDALWVFNRTRAKADEAADAYGANVAETPTDLAARVGAGIIFICVSDTPALEAVVEGAGGLSGLLDAFEPGCLIVDMGTSTVEATRRLAGLVADRGGAYVDAPVSGGEVGAREGALTIMAGGAEADIARAGPYFERMGRAHTHVGPVGAGQVAKAANQLIVAITLGAVSEALLLAEAGGADAAKTREALLGGFAGSRILELHGQRMLDKTFEPGGRAKTQLKDVEQTLALGSQVGLKLPMLEASAGLWREMINRGWGDLDQSGIARVTRALSGRG